MAVFGRAVRQAFLRDAAAQYRRIVRFADNDPGFGACLPQHPRHALERTAGAVTGDPVVEFLVRERLENLGGGGTRVRVGIGFVFELPHQEPAVFLSEFDRLGQHAATLERGGSQHDPGAQEAHELAPLDAEAFSHRYHEWIALAGADHREPDTRIAAGRLDDGLSGAKRAALFGVFDDAEREPVLYRAHRIKGLDLHV